MIHLTNIISLLLTVLWNAGILLGTMWLILEKDWSPWTLVATLFFFATWKILPEENNNNNEIDSPRILLNEHHEQR